MNLQDIVLILVSAGVGGLVIAFSLLYLFAHPEKIFALWQLGAKLLHKLGGVHKRNMVEAALMASLNSAIEQLRKEAPGVFEKSIKIRWIQAEREFSDL